jgi:endonuclease/exonuclease/phosphatase family metal-dependent hydrolase
MGYLGILLAIMFPVLSWARPAVDNCQRLLGEAPPEVYRVVTFNTLNLYYELLDKEGREQKPAGTDWRQKPEHQIQQLGQAMRGLDADIIVLQEVESMNDLLKINREELGGRYDAILKVGNDARGIDIGFLIRKDMPIEIEFETHKDMTWVDPIDGREKPVFSRDAPALIVRKKGETKPQMILIGHHAKSRGDRGGDPQSFILRAAQYDRLEKIIKGYQERFGKDVPVILAGDFNTGIHDSIETVPVRDIMDDSLDMQPHDLSDEERVTHSYFPRRGRPDHKQIDGILITKGSQVEVLRSGVVQDDRGLPRNHRQRQSQASDHYPVYADIKVK